jgi:hypothetical protein
MADRLPDLAVKYEGSKHAGIAESAGRCSEDALLGNA